ncbi:hypothetical protein [Paenibacillus antarcticus]|uniref:DUF4871 domain-containing protein n=1 Tax=Paenibacillus antarcticus TaxID=253703 RepID=A0A168KQU7_9BACL|nr:hypothetical protein [Paenibacillus antarcticus]OAB42345.1 hypothetical protein PBAT_20310 [Paenibacillus antarcticus]
MKVLILVSITLFFSLIVVGCSSDENNIVNKSTTWEIRNTYKSNGKEFSLLSTNFIEGEVTKHGWEFQEHMNNFKGKKMKVIGISKNTQKEVEILSNIDMYVENGDNTPEKTIVPSGFAIPNKGIWRLKVYVDAMFYGDVVIEVEEK